MANSANILPPGTAYYSGWRYCYSFFGRCTAFRYLAKDL
jgi:hypothetical protein